MVNSSWDLASLRVFVAVVRAGGFTRAANTLGYSTAYVSKRIAELEAALGVVLLHRTTRSVHVSSEGQLAYEWALKVLDTAEGLSREVSGARESPSGTLRVATSLRMGRNHVSAILTQLADRYPQLDLWLELVDRRVDLIQEGFDIDIRVGEVNEPHLISHPVVSSSRILCAAPSYLARAGTPGTLAELAGHQCLPFRDRDQPLGIWRLQGPKGEETVRVTGRVGSNHADIVRNWALDGQGVVLLSGWDVAHYLRAGALVRILPEYRQQADIWAVTPARLSSSARLALCVDYLIERLREGPQALDTSFG